MSLTPKAIPVDYIKSVLDYNPSTGEFFWKTRPREHFKSDTVWKSFNKKYVGKLAGSLEQTTSGYQYNSLYVNKVRYKAHRVAWAYIYGDTNSIIDHINGDSLDNRICNLRLSTVSANTFNTGKSPTYTWYGIRPKDSKWEVWFPVEGVSTYFGRYDTEVEAATVRKQLEVQYNILRRE